MKPLLNYFPVAHPFLCSLPYFSSLQGVEGRVYELVVRHFLACVSRDAVGKETTVHIDVNGEEFVGQGLAIAERNYLEVSIAFCRRIRV